MERIKILGRINGKENPHMSLFLCSECGSEIIRQSSNGLRSKNCGCVPKAYKHGDSYRTCKSELYIKWANMKSRCYIKSSTSYPWYGGKGISVCEEWIDYSGFKKWAVKNGYKDGLTIDRKETTKNYTPSNCQWVSRSFNSSNDKYKKIEYKGVLKNTKEYSEEYGIKRSIIVSRIYRGWPIEKALLTPIRGSNGIVK